MKTNKLTNLAMLVLSTASFIGINNCSNRTASNESFELLQEGSSDLAIAPGPINYPVGSIATGTYAGGVPFLYMETACQDGHDEDGDGLVDCQDTDCHIHPECSLYGPPWTMEYSSGFVSYPSGALALEEIFISPKRGYRYDDYTDGWMENEFFPNARLRDCWIDIYQQDVDAYTALGDPLVNGRYGAVDPATGFVIYNGGEPRRGLINECAFGYDLMFYHSDDDNNYYNDEDDDNDERRENRVQ